MVGELLWWDDGNGNEGLLEAGLPCTGELTDDLDCCCDPELGCCPTTIVSGVTTLRATIHDTDGMTGCSPLSVGDYVLMSDNTTPEIWVSDGETPAVFDTGWSGLILACGAGDLLELDWDEIGGCPTGADFEWTLLASWEGDASTCDPLNLYYRFDFEEDVASPCLPCSGFVIVKITEEP